MSVEPVIVAHGGAGAYSVVGLLDITSDRLQEGVAEAVRAGYEVLRRGGSALDAVQEAAVSMEDNPVFNAGIGSYLTAANTIEMDAVVMDGATLDTGAVCCVTNVKNPVKLARLVMDKTKHTMVSGEGAVNLAKSHGLELVPTESLITEKARRRLRNSPQCPMANVQRSHGLDPGEHDTVGAVAVDCHGNVAVANTTGGITGKLVGRVGDTPIVGSGVFADNQSGAVCATGDGEAMVRVCSCKHAAMLMEQGKSPQEALEIALEITRVRGKGTGGMVAVNPRGQVGVHFNTEGMSWAMIKDDTLHYGLYRDEHHTKPLHKTPE